MKTKNVDMKNIYQTSLNIINNRFYILIILMVLSFSGFSQNVGINSTGAAPNANAGLDVDFTNKGILIPRLALTSTSSFAPLSAHVAGMLVYNTATAGDVLPGFYYNTGSVWIPGFTKASVTGTMLYWNGTSWVGITPGITGQYLQVNASNIPFWGGTTGVYATLTTTAATAITATAATTGGNITNDNGFAVLTRGVCYGLTSNPTTANSIVLASPATGTGVYSCNPTGLLSGTTYYVRAYAVNNAVTSYGAEISFTTIASIPTLAATTSASLINGNSASSGGNITADGGAPVIERGICYATTQNPTIAATKVIEGSIGTGTFTTNLTGLSGGTLYYVRAYAINSIGPAYGTQISFTTTVVPPTLATVAAINITGASATTGGSMNWNGGGYSNFQAYGVAYSTTPGSATPTKVATNTSNGAVNPAVNIAPWVTNITGLVANTTYYIRSYLDVYRSGWITIYGPETSFTTTAPTAPILASTTAITGLSANTAVSGGNITSNGGSALTERGVCWGTTTDPTLGVNNFTTDGTNTGIFPSAISGLTASTIYHVRSYATNSAGTSFGPDVQFTTWAQAPFTLGQNLEYGYVAYIAPDGSGFIVSPDIQSTAGWGCDGVNVVGTSTALGTGQANTNLILACSTGTTTAASVANDYNGGGFTDWYLPSSGEWGQINSNYSLLGFSWSYNNYYTSSQYGTNYYNAATYYNTGSYAYASGCKRVPGANDYVSKLRVIRNFGPATLPTVTTDAITSIGGETAFSGGNVTNDGGANIIARGVCWSTAQNPTITDSKTSDGSGAGVFASNITGLTQGTLYYVRAYATNIAGTAYGNQQSFTTIIPSAPTITTEQITNIIATGATSGGTIVSDGGAPITVSGICWNIGGTPTTADGFTTDGTTSGTFASAANGLSPGTTYHLRAYATTSVNTSYGNERSFTTTTPTAPIITTEPITTQTDVMGTSGGTIVSDGGDPITVSGICWSTTTGPTKADSKTTDGSTAGTFYSDATGLTAGTTYYIRAYATNGINTSYGNEITFTPLPVGAPVITTDPIYNLVGSVAVGGANLTTDGGNQITEWGLCWSTTANPTTSSNKVNDTFYLQNPGAANFYANMTGLTLGTTYHVRAYATNSVATTYGEDITFIATAAILGDVIYTGYYTGIVYSVDGTGLHGLIANNYSMGDTDWGCSNSTTGATGTAVGDGKTNTTAILANIATNSCETTQGWGPGNLAPELCTLYLGPGWHLPSKGELDLLWINKALNPDLDFNISEASTFNSFWSSSEVDATPAWSFNGTTWVNTSLKTSVLTVWPVMSF